MSACFLNLIVSLLLFTTVLTKSSELLTKFEAALPLLHYTTISSLVPSVLTSARGAVAAKVSDDTWGAFILAVSEETCRGLLFRFAFSEEIGLGLHDGGGRGEGYLQQGFHSCLALPSPGFGLQQAALTLVIQAFNSITFFCGGFFFWDMADFTTAIIKAETSDVPTNAHFLPLVSFWLGVNANSTEIIPSFTRLQVKGLTLGLVFNDAFSCAISDTASLTFLFT